MVAPPTVWDTPQLTGRTRHRQSLFGKMVLQVEERQRRVTLYGPGRERYSGELLRWRDACFADLYELLNNGAEMAGPVHGV
jgi:hypothetical protein